MSKKLILTISIVLGVILIILLALYFFGGSGNGENGGLGIFKNFFPFGGTSNPPPVDNGGGDGTGSGGGDGNQNPPVVDLTKKLRLISNEPVAGAGVLDVKAGTVVRHIEKATGHIFETELFSSTNKRISNKTLPIVYEAVWGNKTNSLVTRNLKDDNTTVETYSINIKNSSSTENNISGVQLPANIADVVAFDNSIFYLEDGNGFSSGYTIGFDALKKKQIWNSPMKEFLPQYVNSKTVALTTKPYQNMAGFLFLVDTATGATQSVLSKVEGLSTLVSGDASKVLYLEQRGSIGLYLYDVKTKEVTRLNPPTFPEKCVWSKKDKNIVYCAVPKQPIGITSLTSWYRGLVSYEDEIWKYDFKAGTSVSIEDLTADANRGIDLIKPILSDSEQYIVFVSKRDGSLWSLDLTK